MNRSGIIKANEKPPITIKPEIMVIRVQPRVQIISVYLGPIFSDSRPPGNWKSV